MKNNIDDDLDILDELDDLEFEDSDYEYSTDDNEIELEEKDTKGRKPILKTAKKIGKNAGESLKNKSIGDHTNMALENILSNDSRSSLTEIKSMTDSVRDEILKSLEPVKNELSDLMDNVNERIPKEGKIRKIFDFIHSKVKKDAYDSFSSSFDELGYMLEDISSKLEYAKEKEEADINFKNSDLDYKKLSASSLTSINANLRINNEYLKIFNRKSLELQFKTFLILKDTLAVSKTQHSEILKQNEAIIKNTGLPEYVKIKASERMGQAIGTKIASDITDSLFKGDSPIKLMTDNIVANTTAKVNGFLSQLSQLNFGLGMAKGQDIDKEVALGQLAADGIMKGGYWLAGKMVGKDKSAKIDNYIQSFASDPEAFIKNSLEEDPKGIYGKLKDKFLRGALELATTHNKFKEVNLETRSLKDQAIFDGETHRSINMVIPKLLSKIHNELQGIRTGTFEKNNELRFDHDTLSLITTKETSAKLDKTMQTEIFDRTKKSIKNISDIVKEKMKGVSFYGKELIMANLDNAILAYITENGRIHPSDLTKKEFIQYFHPNIQKKVVASFTIFQDLLENDPEKSTVYRTFSSSLTALKNSPAILDKHSNGMNADLLLRDGYYAMDIYGGKVKADVSNISKKMYKRSGVKKHKTDVRSPYSEYANNDISFYSMKDDMLEDIKRFKGKNRKSSYRDINADSNGNVKYNKDGFDFIINRDLYENSEAMDDIGFRIRYDYDLQELINKYRHKDTKPEDKKEIAKNIKTILDKYDADRINLIDGNKFIRAGKRMTGRRLNTSSMSEEWLNRILKGENIDDIFQKSDLSNSEVLKKYGMRYAPKTFSRADDYSKVFKNANFKKVEPKVNKPKPQRTEKVFKRATKREYKTSDAGEAPSTSSVEKKIEKDLDTAIKTKKAQDTINAINSPDLSAYYSYNNINKVEDALNASAEDVNNFVIRKYKVNIKDLNNFESCKLLYVLDKLKDVKQVNPESFTDTFNNAEEPKKEDVKDTASNQEETFESKEKTNKKQKFKFKNYQDDIKSRVKKTAKEKAKEVNDAVNNLKNRFSDQWVDEIEKNIKEKIKKENKAKSKDTGNFVDKLFNLRSKMSELLNPFNILYQGSKFVFSLPRHYKNFFFSDFAKKMRAKERKFLGKLIPGILKSPFTLGKFGIKGLGAIGKGAAHGLRGYGSFYNSDLAKKARKKERNGIGSLFKKIFRIKSDREEAVGKDRRNGWRERLRKLDEEKKRKKDNKAMHVKKDPKDSWLMKLLKPALAFIPLALGKMLDWGKTFFGPIWDGIKGLGSILWDGSKWLGGKIWGGLKWLGGLLIGKNSFSDLPFIGGGKGKKGKTPKGKAPKTKGRFPKMGKFGKAALIGGAVAGGAWLYNKFSNDDEPKETKQNKTKPTKHSMFTEVTDDDVKSEIEREYKNQSYSEALERYKDKITIPDFEDDPHYDIRKDPKYINELKLECAEWEAKERAMRENIDFYNQNKKPSISYDRHVSTYTKGNINKLNSVDVSAIDLENRIEKAKNNYEKLNAEYNQLLGKELSQKEKNILSGKLEGDYTSLPREALKSLERDIKIIAKCKAKLQMAKDDYNNAETWGSGSTWMSETYREYISTFEAEYRAKWMVKGVIPPSHEERLKEASNIQKQAEVWEEKTRALTKGGKQLSDEEKKIIDNMKVGEDVKPTNDKQPSVDDFNSEIDEEDSEELEESSIMESAMGVADTALMAKFGYDAIKGVKNKISPTQAVEAPAKSGGMFGWIKDKASSIWDKAKGVGSKIVDKAKNAIPGQVSDKVKDIAKKIMGILKSFKEKAIKKLGPKAGLKLGVRISAKIASRAVPVVGWALLLADAAQVAWYVFKQGLKIAAAVSIVILGFNLLDDDSVALDEDGNPIKPDDEDPDPKNNQKEYYKEVEKIKNDDLKKAESLTKDMENQYDVPDDMKLSKTNNEKLDSLNSEIKQPSSQGSFRNNDEFSKRMEKYRQYKNQNGWTNGNNKADGYNRYYNTNVNNGQVEDLQFGTFEPDTDNTTSNSDINNLEEINKYFSFNNYGSKFKQYNNATPAEAFTRLSSDFRKRLFGMAKDFHAETGKKLQINSSFRTTPYQGILDGAGPKAKPGFSPHQHGFAVDIQMGEKGVVDSKSGKRVHVGMMPDLGNGNLNLGISKAKALFKKWGLFRPLWYPDSGYKGFQEDWHIEPVWSQDVVKNKDGWTTAIRMAAKNGLRKNYNVNDMNATKAIEQLRQGNLAKFSGSGNNMTESKGMSDGTSPASIANNETGTGNTSSSPNDDKPVMASNTSTESVSKDDKPILASEDKNLNTTPPKVSQDTTIASNDLKPTSIFTPEAEEARNERKQEQEDKNSETFNKTLNVNERQLAMQEEQLKVMKELLDMNREQIATLSREKYSQELSSSRIQNKSKDPEKVSNSPEENIAQNNNEIKTTRPGQAFDLTRRT